MIPDPERRSSFQTASTLIVEQGATCLKFNAFYMVVQAAKHSPKLNSPPSHHLSQLLHDQIGPNDRPTDIFHRRTRLGYRLPVDSRFPSHFRRRSLLSRAGNGGSSANYYDNHNNNHNNNARAIAENDKNGLRLGTKDDSVVVVVVCVHIFVVIITASFLAVFQHTVLPIRQRASGNV